MSYYKTKDRIKCLHKVAKISTSAGEARISLKSLPESLDVVLSLCSNDPETVTITGSEFVAEFQIFKCEVWVSFTLLSQKRPSYLKF